MLGARDVTTALAQGLVAGAGQALRPGQRREEEKREGKGRRKENDEG